MFYGAILAELSPQLVFATLARSYKLIVCRTLSPVVGGGGAMLIISTFLSSREKEPYLTTNKH